MPPPAAPRRPQPPGEVEKLRRLEAEVYARLTKKREKELRVKVRKLARLERRRGHKQRVRVGGSEALQAILGTKTLAQVARAAGMPQATVSLILRGHREPSIGRFVKLVQVLGVSAADLWRYLQKAMEAPIVCEWVTGAELESRRVLQEALTARAAEQIARELAALDPDARQDRLERLGGISG